MRYVLKIAYDGTEYAGWQRQKNALSVQETLENAVKTGIFNRLAQNQHKNIKIYAVDFSS